MSDIPMMNGDGLLECPFCGGDDSFMERDGRRWKVTCGGCWCGTGDRASKLLALGDWNTRKGRLWTVDDFKQMNAERNI